MVSWSIKCVIAKGRKTSCIHGPPNAWPRNDVKLVLAPERATETGRLARPGGKEPYPPAAGGAMVRCAPQEGWDLVLPKESRPSSSCGLSASV